LGSHDFVAVGFWLCEHAVSTPTPSNTAQAHPSLRLTFIVLILFAIRGES
jgi:hypothetical protein